MQSTTVTAIAALCLVYSVTAQAQSSKDFAVMGRIAWAAFACSSLAAQMKDANEQERLFILGYEQGKAFIEAVEAKKVDRKHIREEVPIGLVLHLQGPTPDFMLGRIYESARDEALKDVLRTNGTLNSNEVQELIAQGKYTEQNCQLLRSAN